MSDNANPFWAFSLDRYGRAGVPDHCLTLQDRGRADVNIALFLLWLGSERRAVTPQGVDIITKAVAAWSDDAVIPMRAVRRTLKDYASPADGAVERLRTMVKKVELEAEKIEQQMLFEISRTGFESIRAGSSAEAMDRNLMTYVERLPDQSDEVAHAAHELARLCS